MDGLDTLLDRIEHVELPAGTREVHLERIITGTASVNRNAMQTRPAAVGRPGGRRRKVPVTVLTGAAVVAIVTAAWFLAAPAQQAPIASPGSSPSTTASVAGPTPGSGVVDADLLSAAGTVGRLADLLNVSPEVARTGLIGLRALALQRGSIDPTSAQFGDIASDMGTTGANLAKALDNIKKLRAAQELQSPATPPNAEERAKALQSTPPNAEEKAKSLQSAGSPSTTGDGDDTTSSPARAAADLLAAPEAVGRLADLLNVSPEVARTGLIGLRALALQRGSIDPTSAQFGDIATDLGSTPAELVQALGTIKNAGG